MKYLGLVSVCIPTYNAVKYIQETIECFLNQTYKNVEIIIQDDCSTDGTWELVNSLYKNNEKIRLYRNENNLGIGPNWNAAYEKVQGEYVIIFNADDLVNERFVELGLKEFTNHLNLDIVTFKFQYLFEKNGAIAEHKPQLYLKTGLQSNILNLVLINMPFSWDFTITKKNSLEKLKKNGQLFLNTQVCDFALWIDAGINHFKLYYISKNIGYYRKHSTNNSSIPLAEINSFLSDVNKIYWNKLRHNNYYKRRIKQIRSTTLKYFLKTGRLKAIRLFLKTYFPFSTHKWLT